MSDVLPHNHPTPPHPTPPAPAPPAPGAAAGAAAELVVSVSPLQAPLPGPAVAVAQTARRRRRALMGSYTVLYAWTPGAGAGLLFPHGMPHAGGQVWGRAPGRGNGAGPTR